MADEMLADAQLMFQNHRLKSAADRAYYAMFHAATAALSREVDRLPKTHGGLRTLFARQLVATGKVDVTALRDLTAAFELRQASSYEVAVEVSEAEVGALLANAAAFVAVARRLLGAK